MLAEVLAMTCLAVIGDVQSYRRTPCTAAARLDAARPRAEHGVAATDQTTMPTAPPHSMLTELDPLATPFDARGEVDLLLHDLDLPPVVPGATPAERSAHRAAVVARRSGGGRPVLVVDSVPIARKFLMQRLRRLGYDPYCVDDGEQALALIGRQAFAIVFLELALAPEDGIDGLGLCRAIKQKPDHPHGIAPAVVITTGEAGSSNRVRGSLAGCDAYLIKPLIEEDFLTVLREVDPLFQ
jgi:CheY-like chemotaxis protein